MKQTGEIAEIFNRSGKLALDKPKRIQAFSLFQPYVRLANNYVLKNHQDGSMNVRDPLKKGEHFKDWTIVYSQGRQKHFDDQEGDMLFDILKKASAAFNIKFEEPGFITCDPNLNSFKQEIKADFDKNGKPQIIVLYLNGPQEEKFYG